MFCNCHFFSIIMRHLPLSWSYWPKDCVHEGKQTKTKYTQKIFGRLFCLIICSFLCPVYQNVQNLHSHQLQTALSCFVIFAMLDVCPCGIIMIITTISRAPFLTRAHSTSQWYSTILLTLSGLVASLSFHCHPLHLFTGISARSRTAVSHPASIWRCFRVLRFRWADSCRAGSWHPRGERCVCSVHTQLTAFIRGGAW